MCSVSTLSVSKIAPRYSDLFVMEELPIDLKIETLNFIDEFSDLYNFIRTGHSIYDAFNASRLLILKSTMKRAIGKGLLRDALALHSSQNLLTRDEYAISRFLERWQPGRPCEYPSPGTDQFNLLARHHTLIEFLTRDLFSMMTLGGKGSGPTLLYPAECIRIHRAFYRFQLYCRVFTRDCYPTVDYDDLPEPVDVRELFINKYAHWEIEELTCIHHYLVNRLHNLKPGGLKPDASGPSKRRMSEISTRKLMICSKYPILGVRELLLTILAATASTPILENAISIGLEHFYRLLYASSPIKQNQLLFRSNHPRAWWLGNVLQLHTPFEEAENEAIADRLHSRDPDGPNGAWLKLNGQYIPSCSRGARMKGMYKWGYCLWSASRLDIWKVKDKAWTDGWY